MTEVSICCTHSRSQMFIPDAVVAVVAADVARMPIISMTIISMTINSLCHSGCTMFQILLGVL